MHIATTANCSWGTELDGMDESGGDWVREVAVGEVEGEIVSTGAESACHSTETVSGGAEGVWEEEVAGERFVLKLPAVLE